MKEIKDFSPLEQVLMENNSAAIVIRVPSKAVRGIAPLGIVISKRAPEDFILRTKLSEPRSEPEEHTYQGNWSELCVKLAELGAPITDPRWLESY